ncbi:MAG: ABC transporter permease [Oscillospiraceae bacterium]|nr:ABC transporter permease [Oscillospiraceae bacterium]
MYIIKNAIKCIGRAKGRNILIGIIALVIAVSACIGLCIRQAAESARESTLETLSVTATISFDRQSMMSQMGGRGEKPSENGGGGFDKDSFKEMMGQSGSLSLEEYQTYAKADSVSDFYYTLSASLNGSENFEPVSTDSSDTDSTSGGNSAPSMPGGFGGGMGGGRGQMMGAQSDFSIVGFSGDNAMTAFSSDGTASITDGAVFDEGTENYDCIITEELATFNEIAVGDAIEFTNPNNEDEAYTFTVVGIYTDTAANQDAFSFMGATSTDSANKIYTSYAALKKIVDASEASAVTKTDEDTDREYTTELSSNISATYVFENTDDYYQFEEDVRDLGLDEKYSVSSADLKAFENSMLPLETLSTMAGYFLLVILIIGAIILVVLNILTVRERKYEIGVLTAMGMKKAKVALQFLTEIFVVTLAAVIVGAVIGGVCASPVANALLENQVTSQSSQMQQIDKNFGRDQNFGGGKGGFSGGEMTPPDDLEIPEGMLGGAAEYITEINSAMNITVVLQLLGIAVLLTLVAGLVSMLFVMRYDPLKILSNRD